MGLSVCQHTLAVCMLCIFEMIPAKMWMEMNDYLRRSETVEMFNLEAVAEPRKHDCVEAFEV